jgi:hypothetical protein
MKFAFRDESRKAYGKLVPILLNSSTTELPNTVKPPTQAITISISNIA